MAFPCASHVHLQPNHMLPIYWVSYVLFYHKSLDLKQQPYLKHNHSRVFSPHIVKRMNTVKCAKNRKKPLCICTERLNVWSHCASKFLISLMSLSQPSPLLLTLLHRTVGGGNYGGLVSEVGLLAGQEFWLTLHNLFLFLPLQALFGGIQWIPR